MNVSVVYNPKSGSALPRAELEKLFDAAKITVDAWVDITDNFEKNIRPFCKKGSIIAAIGGDGTIASTANVIAQSGATLAPLPGGTLNHFTKDAGIEQDLAQAIKNITKSSPRAVDLAKVNDSVFLNNSSIGIYPVSLQTRERVENKLGKWPAAVIGTVRALVQFRLYEVTIDNNTFKTPFLFVGNNEYDLDQALQRVSLNQGKLCIYAIESDSRFSLVKLLGAALVGRLRQQDEFLAFTTQNVTIHTKRNRVHVSTDGEVDTKDTPLVYECLPGGITIIGS